MLTTIVQANAYDVAMENFDTAADAMRPGQQYAGDDQVSRAHAHGDRAGAHGRRPHSPLRGLSRAAQLGARPGQGRHPLPSAGHARRSEGAGHVDDVEVRGGEHSVRRRQGRHHLRSEAYVAGRAGADDAPLHQRDSAAHRAGAGHSRARCLHQFANHGLDHGYLQHDQGLSDSRRGDRQAHQPGRIAGTQRGHRPRRLLHHRVRLRASAHAAEGRDRCGAGLWQRRLHRRAAAA